MGATRFPAVDLVILIFQQCIIRPEESFNQILVELIFFKLDKGRTRLALWRDKPGRFTQMRWRTDFAKPMKFCRTMMAFVTIRFGSSRSEDA
jgi:hypothetical protein